LKFGKGEAGFLLFKFSINVRWEECLNAQVDTIGDQTRYLSGGG